MPGVVSSQAVLDKLSCPICLELLDDAVTLTETGITYCSACIRGWLAKGGRICPATNATLRTAEVQPNYVVRSLIASIREELKDAGDAETAASAPPAPVGGLEPAPSGGAPAPAAAPRPQPALPLATVGIGRFPEDAAAANKAAVPPVAAVQAPASIAPPAICERGHQLAYTNEWRSLYRTAHCDMCQCDIPGPSFHCSACRYDLCSGCNLAKVQSLRQGASPPGWPAQRNSAPPRSAAAGGGPGGGAGELRCQTGHRLVFYQPSALPYGGQSGYCNNCMSQDIGRTGSWHCHACRYDICRTCKMFHDATGHLPRTATAWSQQGRLATIGSAEEELAAARRRRAAGVAAGAIALAFCCEIM